MTEQTKIKYLTVEQIVEINRKEVELHGGTFGIRDKGLLESAAAMPAQKIFGQEAHPTIGEKAAAYLFHLCKNHPFEDGNKRTALVAMGCFVEQNGFFFGFSNEYAERLTLDVAEGRVNKKSLMDIFQKIGQERQPENSSVMAQQKRNHEPEL